MTFGQFVADRYGSSWYTAARRCPSYEKRHGFVFIPRKAFAMMKNEYERQIPTKPEQPK